MLGPIPPDPDTNHWVHGFWDAKLMVAAGFGCLVGASVSAWVLPDVDDSAIRSSTQHLRVTAAVELRSPVAGSLFRAIVTPPQTETVQPADYDVVRAPPEELELEVGGAVVVSVAFVAIVGPSGSGKTTLLSILGLLARPDAGEYHLDGQDTANLTEADLEHP